MYKMRTIPKEARDQGWDVCNMPKFRKAYKSYIERVRARIQYANG